MEVCVQFLNEWLSLTGQPTSYNSQNSIFERILFSCGHATLQEALSVRRSVGWSVQVIESKNGKRAYPPLPTRPQLVAVYPALFPTTRVLWQREMSPIDRLHAFLDEQLVGFGEMFAAEETAMRGQRRRMRTA